MRLDAIDVLEERRPGNGAPAITEERWQEILVQSLTELAEQREREQLARAQREREERTRYSFD